MTAATAPATRELLLHALSDSKPLPGGLARAVLDDAPEYLLDDDPPPRTGAGICLDDNTLWVDGQRVGTALFELNRRDLRAAARGTPEWWEVIYQPESRP